jgi:hypothetical protein
MSNDLLSTYNPALQRASVAELKAAKEGDKPSTLSQAAPVAGTILGAIIGGLATGNPLLGAQVGGAIGTGAAGIAEGVRTKKPGAALQGLDSLIGGLGAGKKMLPNPADYLNSPLPPVAGPM